MVVMQIPSSSKGSGGGEFRIPRAVAPRGAEVGRPAATRAAENLPRPTGGAPAVTAVRGEQTLPPGYPHAGRNAGRVVGGRGGAGANWRETVDLCTPPDAEEDNPDPSIEDARRTAAAKRNAARSANRQHQAAFAREAKDSLAGGRPPALKVTDDDPHLKARWHSAAKEVAYKVLDLRKESWKSYSNAEKNKVHRELNAMIKFDPPLDTKRVDKYLAGHLRSARAVWKAHWQRYGSEDRHNKCPEEAWAQLIKWWPTSACKDQSAEMSGRRSLVQNTSRTGRKALMRRMDEEV